MLDEREFELVNIIGAELGANQRDLSRKMNLSLGMTNMLIRRLITKGVIRIQQLNKKKVEYILTPQGFTEKMQKSVRYTMKTLSSIGLIRQSLDRLVGALYEEGIRTFYVVGGADLVSLIEMTFAAGTWPEAALIKGEVPEQAGVDGVLFFCREETGAAVPQGVRVVNVVEELAKDDVMLGQLALA